MSIAALEALAPLFRYPDAAFPLRLAEAREVVPALETFARETAALDAATLEMTYTSTFDLAPSCSPYLGAHLFGEDGAARARLMLGLQRSRSVELPDHIAEVLANASLFEEAEWLELEELVLLPALAKMASLLNTTNPYRLLVDAALGELRVASCDSPAPPLGPEVPRNSQPATPNPLRPENGGAP